MNIKINDSLIELENIIKKGKCKYFTRNKLNITKVERKSKRNTLNM